MQVFGTLEARKVAWASCCLMRSCKGTRLASKLPAQYLGVRHDVSPNPLLGSGHTHRPLRGKTTDGVVSAQVDRATALEGVRLLCCCAPAGLPGLPRGHAVRPGQLPGLQALLLPAGTQLGACSCARKQKLPSPHSLASDLRGALAAASLVIAPLGACCLQVCQLTRRGTAGVLYSVQLRGGPGAAAHTRPPLWLVLLLTSMPADTGGAADNWWHAQLRGGQGAATHT